MLFFCTFHFRWVWVVFLLVFVFGCSSGYRIHRADGVETLYHVNGKGGKRIVYVVNENGVLKVHDENDPLIRKFLSENRLDNDMALFTGTLHVDQKKDQTGLNAQQLLRIGRLKAAKKRDASDPINVTVHDPALGPAIQQRIRHRRVSASLLKKIITDEMNADQIIQLTPHTADVDVFFKSYLKETAALNVKTHKIVPVKAFHFEAYIRSKYLSEHRQTIKGLGHWMYYQDVIKETIQRVNTFIKEEIGSTIPKNRTPFLSANLPKKIISGSSIPQR